jgi:hypothetical protein
MRFNGRSAPRGAPTALLEIIVAADIVIDGLL